MDEISNIINFDINENCPVLENEKNSSNVILNRSAENTLSAVESDAFFQSSPLTVKQVLTSVNNNRENEKQNSSFTLEEYSSKDLSHNIDENILIPSETGTSKTIPLPNSCSLVYETASNIEASNNLSPNLNLCEIPVGNADFLPEALSEEICSNNQKDLRNSDVQCNETLISEVENVGFEELKDEKNNSYVIVQDLVDFSFREQEKVADYLLESFTPIDAASKYPETSTANKLGKFSKLNPTANDKKDKPVSKFSELLETDCAFKVPNYPTIKSHEDSVITDTTENCAIVDESTSSDSPVNVSENPENKDSIADNTSLELEKPTKAPEKMSLIEPIKIDVSPDDVCIGVNSDEATFKVSKNHSNNEQNECSSLKEEKDSFEISDKPVEQFSDHDFEFRLPENPSKETDDFSPLMVEDVAFGMSDNSLEQFPDFVFKVPEVPSNNPLSEFEDDGVAFKVSENFLTNEGDEQFMDAAQFFRDPNSFQFLENIRTSVQPASAAPRSSLYVNFDPLHSKFQTNVSAPDNCEFISTVVQENNASFEKCSIEVLKKPLVDVAARESLGNILISFDSPKTSSCANSKILAQIPSPPKMVTEEELQQKLKIHELETQEAYLKKQREMEMEIAKRDKLLRCQQVVIEEFFGISAKLSADIRKNLEKIMFFEEENDKLKEDLKTSAQDLQSVENTFTDFYKRYEQCKGMLKTYKDNEEHLKQTILDLQNKAKEQEQMYNMLQERTEEMLEKANVEVDNAKRSGEAQVTVLKAQLKKAEMKISSLESDIKQIKIENSQLGGICDDLMAKVSKS